MILKKLYWSYTIGKVHTKTSSKIKRLLRDACLQKPRSLHSQWLMKSQLMEQVPARKINTDMERWNMICLRCSVHTLTEPRRWVEVVFKMVMEWWLFIFSLNRFFNRVSYTCSSNYSVYDGRCTHTHLSHAHFSAHSALTAYFTHLHTCHIHVWLKCL